MCKFLTSRSVLEQTEANGLWITSINQLFKDNDGTIYLVPRNFTTDGYTIPDWIAWLGGGRMKWDTRCSTQHDFECKYAEVIVVNLTEHQLRKMRYLVDHDNKTICRDIPSYYLTVKKSTFNQANSRFKRMMLATSNIPKWRINMMRFAVNFNLGWHSCKTSVDLEKIYIDEI